MSKVSVANWRPRSEYNAMELFEAPCRADVWLYGSYGGETSVREDDERASIAFEFNPDDRELVIGALSEMLELMRSAK